MAKLVRKGKAAEADFLPNVLRMAAIAADLKAIDIMALDMRGLSLVADCFVICSAASAPQIKAIHRAVKDGVKESGLAPLRSEGELNGGWLVLDYGDILFHLFRSEAREFYDLEGLWGDAPKIDLADVL